MKNYVKLPLSDFSSFKNLRKIEIRGQRVCRVEILNLHDFFTQFMTLPTGQLRSFRLINADTDIQSTPAEALLNFIQKQRQSLEHLELSVNSKFLQQPVKLPRCMPNLKTLWVSGDRDRTGSDYLWGVILESQVAKKSGEFTYEFKSRVAPFVVREGSKCGLESCRSCNDALAYGVWQKNYGQ